LTSVFLLTIKNKSFHFPEDNLSKETARLLSAAYFKAVPPSAAQPVHPLSTLLPYKKLPLQGARCARKYCCPMCVPHCSAILTDLIPAFHRNTATTLIQKNSITTENLNASFTIPFFGLPFFDSRMHSIILSLFFIIRPFFCKSTKK
jgi:hypothetical protein